MNNTLQYARLYSIHATLNTQHTYVKYILLTSLTENTATRRNDEVP